MIALPRIVWKVYCPRRWSALHARSAEETIVFDFETTGTEKHLDEAVSIAVQSYASPSGAPVKNHSLIAPRFPGKLLERNAKGECAYRKAKLRRWRRRWGRRFRRLTMRRTM